jgi:hypothetical protein
MNNKMVKKASKAAATALKADNQGYLGHETRSYSNLPEWIKALNYCLAQSKKGRMVSSHEYAKLPHGNHYFRNHFAKNGEILNRGIEVDKDWRTHPISGKRYRVYGIKRSAFNKALEILKNYDKSLG